MWCDWLTDCDVKPLYCGKALPSTDHCCPLPIAAQHAGCRRGVNLCASWQIFEIKIISLSSSCATYSERNVLSKPLTQTWEQVCLLSELQQRGCGRDGAASLICLRRVLFTRSATFSQNHWLRHGNRFAFCPNFNNEAVDVMEQLLWSSNTLSWTKFLVYSFILRCCLYCS